MPEIDKVPAGFTPHTDDSSKYGYPAGVEHTTIVDVVIRHDGRNFIHYGKPANNFGWAIEPARPSSPGLEPCGAPITHYRIPPELPKAGPGPCPTCPHGLGLNCRTCYPVQYK